MGIYEFKKQDAYDFARHVGAKANTKGDELFFKICPYCHGKGVGNDNSFSINLRTGQFKCFRDGCGAQGNMITLSKDFDFSLGFQVDEYFTPKKTYRSLPKPKKPIEPKPEAIKFLESRGISEAVAKKYQITVQDNRPNVLVFPFFDDRDELVSVKYRKTDFDKSKDNCKEWFEKDTKLILFGMAQCNPDNRTMILTEGQMDALAVATAGIENAVSVPSGSKGMTWIPHCWNWINENFDTIIVFGDYEKGHITLLEDVRKRFKLNIKHVREEDYKDCKDANDILKKYGVGQIKVCIENAIPLPVRDVVSLADVEDVDIFKLEKLQTGITQLDKLLYGGLPFGGVHLISGKAGQGKSTLASQIVVNAREQGYKCFCYSGELPNYLFKAWMDFQVAGTRSFEYENTWREKNYNISEPNRRIISEWYRDYVWLYDANMLDDEEEHVGLIKTAENMILQNGCRVILLDNLMTALDGEHMDGFDKYDLQSRFVKKLANLARQYDVCVLLVAHKRKNNFSTNINDEIMGSSDIGNLGMVTLAYERDDDIDGNDRLLKVAKNRLFGKVNNEGWVVHYDERSKRIYGDGDNVAKQFSCFVGENGFSEINEETPWG